MFYKYARNWEFQPSFFRCIATDIMRLRHIMGYCFPICRSGFHRVGRV